MTTPIHLNGHPLTPADPTFDTPTCDLQGWRIREDDRGLFAHDPSGPVTVRIEDSSIVFMARQGGRFELPMMVVEELVRRQRGRMAEELAKGVEP